jgi:N-ethylmaleimide reductase
MPVPRALKTDEVPEHVRSYAHAARRAIDAGFDGVELHGTNGYLISQFLSSNANLRDDRYGGSITNRIRFAVRGSRRHRRGRGRRPYRHPPVRAAAVSGV